MHLFAVVEFDEPQDVATTEGLPSSLVGGCVCAISGEYTDSVVDLVIPGPEPLVISRVYNSFSGHCPWHFNHKEKILTEFGAYRNKAHHACYLYQANGARLNYICEAKKYTKDKMNEFEFVVPQGLTNGATALSGKTNLKNQRFYRSKHEVKVLSGAGNVKFFEEGELTDNYDNTYWKISEEKANGSRYKYEGKSIGLMGTSKIICENKKNKTEYSNVSIRMFDIDGGDCQTIETSDHRKLTYFFKSHKYHTHDKYDAAQDYIPITRHYLTEVNHPYAPKEVYKYGEKALNRDWQITSKSRDHGKRFLNIDYYHEGKNEVGGNVGIIDLDDENFRLDRVKKLKAPVGTDQTPITTHRFDYNFTVKKHKITGQKSLSDGYTDVYDAENHKTRYSCDKEHRLTSITHFSGNGTEDSPYHTYTKESYIWNEEGNLTAKIFKARDGMIHHARFFTYDKSGNVLTSTLCGNLTGDPNAPQILLEESGFPIENGYERDVKTYTYSNDGLNLLLTETDASGKTTRYQYEEKSDRKKAKFISFNNRIQLREFYYYDDNHALKEKITDDGSGELDTDLTNLTERHHLVIKPRTQAPIGLPEQIEERYLSKNEKKLLKSSICKYSPEGRLIKQQVYDANGIPAYTLKWEYDKHGNLISETNAEDVTLTKNYDLSTDNLISQEQTAQSVQIENQYDFVNRLIKQNEIHGDQEFVTSRKYNVLNLCTTITNSFGHETNQKFDDFGRIISIEYPLLPNEEGTLVKPFIQKEYECGGFPISLTDAIGNTTLIKNNIRGQPTQILYPDGTQEEMRYSVEGKLLQKIEKNRTRIEYIRDPLGRVLVETIDGGDQKKQTTHRYNAFHLLETTDPEGNFTVYTYDEAGRIIKTCKNDRCTENIYDSLSRLSETREYYGDKPKEYRATIKKYDKSDQVIEERLQSSDGIAIHLAIYEYDKLGNRILEKVGDQKTTTIYDSHNQPIKIIDSLGNETQIEYDYNFLNSHKQQVLQTTTTDPLGYRTVETYDTANRIVESVRLNPLGLKVARQTNHYDLCGNKKRVEEEVIENGKVVRTIQTKFQYNALNEIIQITEAANTPEQKITRTLYNTFGQKDAVTKPDGTTLHYTYDSFGRLKTTTSSDQSISYAYQYNLLDQVLEVEDLNTHKKTERIYNQGDLIKETLSNGLSLTFTYDKTGRAKTITYPDQTGLEYTYNAVDLKEIHRIINGTRIYTHRDDSHSLSGQVLKTTLPGSHGTVDYAFDSLGHCIQIDTAAFQQHVPPDGFDAAGNLLKYEAQETSYQFTYDDNYQINSESGHADHSYAYDSLSNRIVKDKETHQHNSLNQIIKKGKEQLLYDHNGNLIQNGSFTYAYDALDRLIKVTQNGNETTYTYDAFNRRMAKKQNGEEEYFLYQGQEEIGRWKNNQVQELRLLGKNPRNPMVALEIKGTPYVPLHDMSGNVICLLDLKGEVIERYRYTSFGESEILSPTGERRSRSTIGNPWQYASKRLDEETGLIAFGVRYYDPSLGRWITPDPAGFTDGPNLYAYVHNCPLLNFDQFGLFTEGLFGAFGIATQVFQTNYNQYPSYLGLGTTPESAQLGLQHFNIEDKLEHKYNFRKQDSDPPFHRTRTYSANDFINPETNNNYNFKQLPPGKGILFNNGIDNNISDFKSSLIYIAELSGGYNVQGVFCPTFGTALDIATCQQSLYNYAAFEGTREIQRVIRAFDAANSPEATLLNLPHSRGVIYSRNALIDSSSALRNRVEARAFAPGGYIERHLCKSIRHYVNKYDGVPLLDLRGMIRCRDSIVTLQPPVKLSGVYPSDHPFTSKIYEPFLRKELREYLLN